MASKVELCNFSLADISANLINSLDKPYKSREALICDQWYDRVRRELLREFQWNFATTTRALTLLDTTNDLGFTYNYSVPNESLKVVKLLYADGPSDSNVPGIPFQLMYNRDLKITTIVTDLEEAIVKYVVDIENTLQFDDTFITAFNFRLSAAIAPSLLGAVLGGQVAAGKLQQYQFALLKAEAISAREELPEDEVANYYVDSRCS